MTDNQINPARLNHTQRIVLIGASFDPDTWSAAAWLAANGLPIRMIEVQPHKVGDLYLLNATQLIPVAVYEDIYVSVLPGSEGRGTKATTNGTKAVLPFLSRQVAAMTTIGFCAARQTQTTESPACDAGPAIRRRNGIDRYSGGPFCRRGKCRRIFPDELLHAQGRLAR